jgi:outer membrane protein assembly factor BamD
MKSPDKAFRLEKAKEYFANEDYEKAKILIEDLIPLYRGTAVNEELYYMYGYTYYYQKDYFSASSYFQLFGETFPKSDKAEEVAYLSAKCAYFESPRYTLDQEVSKQALEKFQLFMENYPNSPKVDSCNFYIDDLRMKFEQKAFHNAKIYYNIQEYQASVVAFKNALKEFPASANEEEMRFLMLDASYRLASNSVESKKERRLRETIVVYQNYIDKFANSEKAKDAENIYSKTLDQLENFNL